jgi:hypothetical protein
MKGWGQMRLTISGFVLLSIFFSTPAYTQVKRWIDKKGIVHLEGTGPERPKGSDSSQAKPNALRPIERNFTDLRLGDAESLFTAANKAVHVANNGYDGNFYSYSGGLPEGAIKMGVLFNTGRLALITIEYRDVGSAGWDQLVKESTKKYGPALGDNRTAGWHDGTTTLNLRHELNGNITITLEDSAAMSKYSEQERAALPKL